MKTFKVLILCVIIGLMTIPAVSAEKVYSENSNSGVILDSTGENYIVSPWIENSFDTKNSISSLRGCLKIQTIYTIG